MNQKNLHIFCDIILFIPLLGILISLFLLSNTLKDDIFIIKQLFDEWNNKPIQILQESYKKTCSEIGMYDLLSYDWPGIKQGCFCENNKKLYKNSCRENNLNQNDCKDISAKKNISMKKWKGSYFCGSSIKPKSYFELNLVNKNERCSQKYKKCGIIDSLQNYLCVPENEICPLNKIEFMQGMENVRIETSNKKLDGKIFSSFKIAEKQLCLNNNQRYFSEKDYLLINTLKDNESSSNLKTEFYLNGCHTAITDSQGKKHYSFLNYEIIDSDDKLSFYRKNEEFYNEVSQIPNYLSNYQHQFKMDDSNKMFLYASVYPGWKNNCDRKEFKNYLKSNREMEILEIFQKTEFNEDLFMIYSLLSMAFFLIGIIYVKYSVFIGSYNKFEYSISASAIMSLFYSGILASNSVLLYFADFNLEFIKNAKNSTNFFELVSSNSCSDDITNASLKHVAKQFFSFANKYFNMKVLSVFVIIAAFINCSITFFIRQSGDGSLRKIYNKKKNN